MNNLFLKLPFSYDPALLQADLQVCLKYVWPSHYYDQNYSGDWSIIALRSVDGSQAQIQAFGSQTFQDTTLLAECTYFRQILDSFPGEKTSVRLMRLGPGSEVKAHTDHRLSYLDGDFRIHIPVQTNPEVWFFFEENPVQMEPGSCWYGDFSRLHRVSNSGRSPRIHLVIDCQRNAWWDEQFQQAGFTIPETDQKIAGVPRENLPEMIRLLEAMDTEAARKLVLELKARL